MPGRPEDAFDGMLLAMAQRCEGIPDLWAVFLSFLRRKTDAFDPPGGWKQLEETFLDALRREYDIAQAGKRKVKKSDVVEMSADGSFDLSKATPSNAAAKSAVPSTSTKAADPVPPSSKASSESVTTTTTTADTTTSSDILPGNGGKTDRYTWTQTLSDVNIQFPVPSQLRARDITVEFKPTSIKVGIKGQEPLLQGKLPKRIKIGEEENTWTLEDDAKASAKILTVFLTKEHQMEWWDRVAEGEPAIDITKINPENSKLSDLDSDTRSVVEKMMFDQRQKMMGLPSSDELKKQEVLERFMKAHPEMDFSNAKIN